MYAVRRMRPLVARVDCYRDRGGQRNEPHHHQTHTGRVLDFADPIMHTIYESCILSQVLVTYHVTYPGCTIPHIRLPPAGELPSWRGIRGQITQNDNVSSHNITCLISVDQYQPPQSITNSLFTQCDIRRRITKAR